VRTLIAVSMPVMLKHYYVPASFGGIADPTTLITQEWTIARFFAGNHAVGPDWRCQKKPSIASEVPHN
jgi:hypothetical protein